MGAGTASAVVVYGISDRTFVHRCKGCKTAKGSRSTMVDCVLKGWLKNQKGLTKEEMQSAVQESDGDI